MLRKQAGQISPCGLALLDGPPTPDTAVRTGSAGVGELVAAALALGVAAGVPWLVNPVLAALSVLLAHAIASRMAGRDQADLVALSAGRVEPAEADAADAGTRGAADQRGAGAEASTRGCCVQSS